MSDFLKRRAEQLRKEGKGELARDLALTPKVDSEEEVPFHEEGDLDPREILTHVARVKGVIESLHVVGSSFSLASASQEVAQMSVQERAAVLVGTLDRDVQKKPVFYSVLADYVRGDLEEFYDQIIEKRGELERLFAQFFPFTRPRILSDDREKVARMTDCEMHDALGYMTYDDVRNRGSFYGALLERTRREI